jgi:hypothetical protein
MDRSKSPRRNKALAFHLHADDSQPSTPGPRHDLKSPKRADSEWQLSCHPASRARVHPLLPSEVSCSPH